MRFRLILSFVVVVLVTVAAFAIFLFFDNPRQVRAYMYGGAMIDVEQLASRLEEYYISNGDWAGVAQVISSGSMMGQSHRGGMPGSMGAMMNSLILADPDGRIIAAVNEDAGPGDRLSRRELLRAIELEAGPGRTAGYLLVGGLNRFNAGQEAPLIQSLNQAAFRASLVALAAALVTALIFSTGVLRPVQQLTRAAQKAAAGDLSHRVPVRGDDELAGLAVSFNTMLDSLKHSERRRREMTADIAHELRTPLAVQKATIEALQDGIYLLTPENLQPILEQNELLARLVEDLRTLALADAGELHLEKGPVDLVELAEEVIDDFQAPAGERKVQLVLEADRVHPVITLADRGRLRQILNNLLQNALRYTPEGGMVSLRIAQEGGQAVMEVVDSGAGIPADALPYIFERFYRADRARSRSDGGTGLGLAIARQLARAHQGDLTAHNLEVGGAKFRLTLTAA